MGKRLLAVWLLLVFLCISVMGFAEELPAEEEGTGANIQEEVIETDEEALPVITEETKEAEEEIKGEEEPAKEQSAVSFDIAFTGGAECVVIGDTLTTEITIRNYGKEFTATARWLINGSPVEAFTNPAFPIFDGKTSVFPKPITIDFWNWGEVRIGFEILIEDEVYYSIEKLVTVKNVPYSDEQISEVLNKVEPVEVEAWLRRDAVLYTGVKCTVKKGTVQKGTKVICLNSKTDFSNQIRLPDGTTGWVLVEDLRVTTKNYTKPLDLTNWDKNIFVNTKGYDSETEYLIWVNLDRQRVNVFKGSKGNWSIEGAFPCASGKNVTPTITGEFEYQKMIDAWKYDNYYVAPVMVFCGSYALHSVLLSYDGGVYSGTVGSPRSNGCVRLLKHHIDWLAENIPLNTKVVVY